MISFSESVAGFPTLTINHPSGSSVTLHEYGAQVTSWCLTDKTEVFYLSPAAIYKVGDPIRGGVPLVFPQFGKGKLPSHGFARISRWSTVHQGVLENGNVFVVLRLTDKQIEEGLGFAGLFKAELEITLSKSLSMVFSVENQGEEDLVFQHAFHSYFNLTEIDNVTIDGLKGEKFVDFLSERKEFLEQRQTVKIFEEIDRCYKNVITDPLVRDSGKNRRIEIKRSGLKDVVIWNPWDAGCKKIADLAPDSYRSFVCVETGNIETPVVVKPGDRFSCSQILSILS